MNRPKNASEGPIIVCVKLLQIKVLQPKKLAVLKCTCLRGSPSRLTVGETCFIRVNGVAALDALTSRTPGPDSGKTTGRWCAAEDDTVLLMKSDASLHVERNRRGVKILECVDLLQIGERSDSADCCDNGSCLNDSENYFCIALRDKSERHQMFAQWLVDQYGADKLATGVLDVAGGNGELSRALLGLGVPAILLDPRPRCFDERIPVIAEALHGNGSELLDSKYESVREKLRKCSLVAGLHPDQATEAIIDLSERLDVPFALLPCCVMPSLFPQRKQKRHGDPVRSYSSFCQYLLDKAPEGSEYQVDHLPFVGRNKIIFSTK